MTGNCVSAATSFQSGACRSSAVHSGIHPNSCSQTDRLILFQSCQERKTFHSRECTSDRHTSAPQSRVSPEGLCNSILRKPPRSFEGRRSATPGGQRGKTESHVVQHSVTKNCRGVLREV